MKIDLPRELARLRRRDPSVRRQVLQALHVEDAASLEIAVLDPNAPPELWRIHDDGDALLLVLSGRILVELRQPAGACDWSTIASGQCILIRSGTAHAISALERTEALWITPREGDRPWRTLTSDAADEANLR